MLILIGCFAPLALFKLLAFVDPGTSSGAAMRAGMAAQGGLQGLLRRRHAGGGGRRAASSTDSNGRSSGESTGEDATSARFATPPAGSSAPLGPVGQAAATGVGAGRVARGHARPRSART
jgi:type IV secretion system protein TrbL